MATFGNAGSISSLLSSAQAARKRQESLQDSIASYEWDLSAKTQEDYAKYAQHLATRAKMYGEADPARSLEYEKKITSAQRGYTSAEISRATTQVLYGAGTNRDKYNTIAQLYQSAIENGDENLAQRLESQAARLSMTIQNEEIAAGNAAQAAFEKGQASTKKQYNRMVKDAENDLKKLDQELASGKRTIAEYVAGRNSIQQTKMQVLTMASNDTNLNEDDLQDFRDKASNFAQDDKFKKDQYYLDSLNKSIKDGQLDPKMLPFALRKDAVTGELKIEDAKVVGKTGVNYGQVPTFGAPGGDNYTFLRTIDKGGESGLSKFNETIYSSKDNPNLQEAQNKIGEFKYYVDPITGQEIVVDPNDPNPSGRRRLKDLVETKDFQDKLKTEGDKEYYDTLGKSVSSLPSRLGTAALKAAGGPLSTIIDNFKAYQAVQEAKRKEAALFAERERAKIASALPAVQAAMPASAQFKYNKVGGVSTAAPFDPMKAAANLSQKSGSAAPVINTYLGSSPFGARNALSSGGGAYSIINSSTNYGGAVDALRKSGYDPSTYDKELRWANNNPYAGTDFTGKVNKGIFR